MRKPGGYAIWTNPESPTVERDTFTCCHCGCVVFVKPRAAPAECGGFCRLCMKPICGPCTDLGKCDPFENKLERAEASYRFRRSAGLM